MSIDITSLPVFYISFTQKPDLEQKLKKRQFTDINHFPAVNGKKLDLDYLYKTGKIGNRVFYELTHGRSDGAGISSKGALGCYLSHISLYKKMVDEDIPYAIISEDDTILKKFKKNKLNNIVTEVYQQEPDTLLLFGVHSNEFKKESLSDENSLQKDIDQVQKFYGTHFYMISKETCKKILKHALPIEMQIDSFLSTIGNKEEINIQSLKHKIADYEPFRNIFNSSVQKPCYKCLLPNSPWFYRIFIPVFLILLIFGIIIFVKYKNCKKNC